MTVADPSAIMIALNDPSDRLACEIPPSRILVSDLLIRPLPLADRWPVLAPDAAL